MAELRLAEVKYLVQGHTSVEPIFKLKSVYAGALAYPGLLSPPNKPLT
jgi:hypothetical protein